MKKINVNINKKSLWSIAIYATILLLFVLVGILPFYLKNSYLSKGNHKLKYQIEEQKQLAPLYVSLQNDMKSKDLLVLPHPETAPLAREDAAKFKDDFRVIAEKSRMKIISFTPELSTLEGASKSLLYNIMLKGEFADFRKMLTGLGGVPYLDKIGEVDIQQNTDSMDFKMKIWIALK
jgi:hypothetical protein